MDRLSEMIIFPGTVRFWANSSHISCKVSDHRLPNYQIPRDDQIPRNDQIPRTIRFPDDQISRDDQIPKKDQIPRDDQIRSKLHPAGLSAARSEMIGWGRPRETLPCNKAALWLTHDRYPTRDLDDDDKVMKEQLAFYVFCACMLSWRIN